MKIRELWEDQTAWTQHAFARDARGHDVSPLGSLHPSAVSWCLAGVLGRCYPDGKDAQRVWHRLHAALFELGESSVVRFNDSRSFREVKDLVDRLDI